MFKIFTFNEKWLVQRVLVCLLGVSFNVPLLIVVYAIKVLGTFIMEWDEGRIMANKLLSTKESAQMYAERLTELAVALGFDGWLVSSC